MVISRDGLWVCVCVFAYPPMSMCGWWAKDSFGCQSSGAKQLLFFPLEIGFLTSLEHSKKDSWPAACLSLSNNGFHLCSTLSFSTLSSGGGILQAIYFSNHLPRSFYNILKKSVQWWMPIKDQLYGTKQNHWQWLIKAKAIKIMILVMT